MQCCSSTILRNCVIYNVVLIIHCDSTAPGAAAYALIMKICCSLWLAFVLCNCPEAAKDSWLDGNVGVDRPGGNLPGMPVLLDRARDCGSLCWSHSGCMAWSFSNAGCSDGGSSCYLKAIVMEQSFNACMVKCLAATLDTRVEM